MTFKMRARKQGVSKSDNEERRTGNVRTGEYTFQKKKKKERHAEPKMFVECDFLGERRVVKKAAKQQKPKLGLEKEKDQQRHDLL